MQGQYFALKMPVFALFQKMKWFYAVDHWVLNDFVSRKFI